VRTLGLIVFLALVLAAPAAGEQAPPISGTTLDGKRLSLASFRGKTAYLIVWASW